MPSSMLISWMAVSMASCQSLVLLPRSDWMRMMRVMVADASQIVDIGGKIGGLDEAAGEDANEGDLFGETR